MTARAPGEPGRGAVAPTRTAWTRDGVGAILIVLAAALAFRLIIAYAYPDTGLEFDVRSFQSWASNLADEGLHGFYERPFFHDYTPGYLYVLYAVGLIGQAAGGIGDLIKLPAIFADIAIGWLVWSMATRARGQPQDGARGGRPRRRESGQLVRFGHVGPGRFVRRRVPPARPPQSLARPARAGSALDGGRSPHQAATRDSRASRRRGDDPAGALARRRPRSAGSGARARRATR